jgi:hypothetical protein
MRWVTREYVRTAQAKRRSVWHRWFAWYPVIVSVEEQFDHWVWLERLDRKWSLGRYGDCKGHWRYRHPLRRPLADLPAGRHDVTRDGPEGRVPPLRGGHEASPEESSRLH